MVTVDTCPGPNQDCVSTKVFGIKQADLAWAETDSDADDLRTVIQHHYHNSDLEAQSHGSLTFNGKEGLKSIEWQFEVRPSSYFSGWTQHEKIGMADRMNGAKSITGTDEYVYFGDHVGTHPMTVFASQQWTRSIARSAD